MKRKNNFLHNQSEPQNHNWLSNYDLFSDDKLSIQQKLELFPTIKLSDLFNIISQLSQDSENETNFYLICLYFRNKISNFPDTLWKIYELFKNSSPENQILINDVLYNILTYSSHRHFSPDFIENFSSPNTQTINELFDKLNKDAKNQFISYSLNSTLTSYLDMSQSEWNFSRIAKNLYSKYKVHSNHVYFEGKQFWSILRLCKDHLIFSSKDKAEWLTKINPEILEIDDATKSDIDTYFIYDEIQDMYIHNELWEKNHLHYHKYKNQTLKIPNNYNVALFSHKIIAKILVYIHNYGEEKINNLEYIFSQIFWLNFSNKLTQTFSEIYSHLWITSPQMRLEWMRKFRDDKIDDDKVISLLRDFAWYIKQSEIHKIEDKRIALKLNTYQECIDNEANIFNNSFPVDKSEKYMKSLHTPKMLNEFNKKVTFTHLDNLHVFANIDDDLWVDITQLLFSNQIYLFHFLWSKTPQEFKKFKDVLEKQQDKISFLNTFLACSKNPEIWDKILELAEHPDSGKIFEAYAQLIDLQSEIDSKDISSIDFLKTLISRWEKLLLEALEDSKNSDTLEIDEKYSQELVKSGAFVKALIKNQQNWEVMSMEEFNVKCPDYEIVTHQWALFHGISEIDLFDDNNFPYPETLNSQDIQNIINWSKIAFQSSQKQQEFIYKNIVETFKNPNARHIFLKSKSNANTIWYCKMIWNYFWSLYIDPNFIGDFWIGDLIQKIAINKFWNNSFPISASAFLDWNILERHINRLSWLWKEICYTPNWEAYLNFEWNSNIEVHNQKDIKNFENIEELSHLCEKYFQNNFVLTNIKYLENWCGSVVFQQKEKES